jgi:ABC-type polysaccharide/polyol phosphate export permease
MSYFKDFFIILKNIIRDRKMLWELSKNDFKARFASSMLGIVWAYIQPLATILVFWYVFQVGLRSNDMDGLPFIVWYTPAFLIWTFFQDTLSTMTNSIRDYSYLVRKVNFNVSMIPFVKLISGSFVHIAFIVFIFIINLVYGVPISVFNVQVLYYFLCTVALLTGLGLICATITPFVGDIPNVVSVVLQVLFWATPIVWNPSILSDDVAKIMKLNPMFYICTGYRETFQGQRWFWDRPETPWFWIGSFILIFIGGHLFQKMNKDFVDVL